MKKSIIGIIYDRINDTINWLKKAKTFLIWLKFDTFALDELRKMANRTTFDERGNNNIAIADISQALVIDYLHWVKSPLARDFEKMPFLEVLNQMDLLTGPKEKRLIKNVAWAFP